MKIQDNRYINEIKLTWDNLLTGKFYQADDGTILLKTDGDTYVHIGDTQMSTSNISGTLFQSSDFDNGSREKFVELDVTIVINKEI